MADAPRATTALALRNPEAFRRAPEFYPEGHAGPELATVLLGAPAAASLGTGLLLALLGTGPGAVLGALFAVPVASLAANNRLSSRGKGALAQARILYVRDTERGLAALEAVAQSGALPEVRLEAAALVAQHRIETGDIRGAVDALSIHEQDAGKLRRRRNWEVGLRGEVLRSILAWLSPGSFVESGVAGSDAFDEREITEEGQALVALLRVLERAAETDDGALATAWRNARGANLSGLYPTLYAVGLAVSAERLHHLIDRLHEVLDGERGEFYRGVLRQLFPRMQLLDAGGYREASPEDPTVMTQAVTVAAPKEVVALARPGDLMPPASFAPQAFAGTYGTIIGLATISGLAMGSGVAGAVVGFFMSVYFGTPFAAIWGSRRTQALRRAHRVEALAALDPAPPRAWLEECASGPPGPVTRTSGYRRLLPIPEGTMVVYVAVAKAEAALARLEAQEAWSYVSWWYESFSGRLQHDTSMYAAGSALVRIATLTGHAADARRLMAALPERGNEWDGPHNRSIRGNAPFATRLAEALLLALEGDWEMSRARIEWALQAPAVDLSENDRALYERIAYQASKAGVSVRWPYSSTDPAAKTWASAVWPTDSEA
ncbi:MAG: hypothetical protein ACE37F_08155 [Nannocystaceae bacterium]|nr:hypothetical protein [bacterium]